MNPAIELNFWLRLLGILALEIIAVVALAFAAQALTQSAFWRRAIWQSCLVCLALLVASEISGIGRGIAVWFAGKPAIERNISVRILPANEQFISAPIENEISPPMDFSEKPAPVARSIWWPGILWLAGFAVIVARILFARILFLSLRWRKAEITDTALQNRVSDLALHLRVRRKIHLLESPVFSSPMTFGIAQPCIALPKDFTKQFSPAEQNAMLAHELAHVAARDSLWYLLADLTSAILWWHPLVWVARRHLHSASELAADEAAAILENGPGALAECLVNLGRRMTQTRAFGWLGVDGNGFRSHLGQRVERLLNLKTAEIKQRRSWPFFVARSAFSILFAGLILFTSGWIQNGKQPREKDFTSAVQKSWNDSFASTTFTALSVQQEILIAKNETPPARTVAKFPHYEDVTFETLIYNDFSPEELKQVEAMLQRDFSSKNAVAMVSSNKLQRILFGLSNFKERMTSPFDRGQFIAPFDMVGSKLVGARITYQGSPTNRQNTCTYFTDIKNGIRVVTAAEISYPASNLWSFSVTPQKRDGTTELILAWNDNSRVTIKKFMMPRVGGAIVQRRFSDDPSRNQLIVFSAALWPRPKEQAGDQNSRNAELKIEAAALVQESKLLYEAGNLKDAENKLKEVLRKDAENKAAIYYKSLIKESKPAQSEPGAKLIHPTIPPKILDKTVIETPRVPPSNNSANRTNVVYTSKGRQTIKAKLDRIRLGEVQFENLPLRDVLKILRDESKNADEVGINFMFNPHPLAVPTNLLDGTVWTPASANEIKIHISPALKDVRMLDVLDTIVRVSKQPLEYKIEDYAVVFSPKTAEPILLYTRTFQLNPGFVAERLGMVVPPKSADGNSDAARTNFQAQLNQKVKNFFETAGVNFDAPGNTTGKAIFFNARTGSLIVRATKEDLEKIGYTISLKLTEPPQVTVEARFVELTDSAMNKIDLNRFTQNAIFSTKKLAASDIFLSGTNVTRSNLVAQKSMTNAFPAVIAIFDEAQYERLHKALDDGGAETIALPKVTTLSGRRAQISMLDMVTFTNANGIATNGSPTNSIPIGSMLDVLPTVSEGFAIEMTLIATVTEFLGYDKTGPTPLPQARLHSVMDSVKIWDGQTVMLGKIEKGKTEGNQKNLLVFVTATIIDAVGNRVHSEAELPFATNSVPKQVNKSEL